MIPAVGSSDLESGYVQSLYNSYGNVERARAVDRAASPVVSLRAVTDVVELSPAAQRIIDQANRLPNIQK
jgi:hypothetical protein